MAHPARPSPSVREQEYDACNAASQAMAYAMIQQFQRFQHCEAPPKLPVLPTSPAGPLPSAEAAGTGVDGWDEP